MPSPAVVGGYGNASWEESSLSGLSGAPSYYGPSTPQDAASVAGYPYRVGPHHHHHHHRSLHPPPPPPPGGAGAAFPRYGVLPGGYSATPEVQYETPPSLSAARYGHGGAYSSSGLSAASPLPPAPRTVVVSHGGVDHKVQQVSAESFNGTIEFTLPRSSEPCRYLALPQGSGATPDAIFDIARHDIYSDIASTFGVVHSSRVYPTAADKRITVSNPKVSPHARYDVWVVAPDPYSLQAPQPQQQHPAPRTPPRLPYAAGAAAAAHLASPTVPFPVEDSFLEDRHPASPYTAYQAATAAAAAIYPMPPSPLPPQQQLQQAHQVPPPPQQPQQQLQQPEPPAGGHRTLSPVRPQSPEGPTTPPQEFARQYRTLSPDLRNGAVTTESATSPFAPSPLLLRQQQQQQPQTRYEAPPYAGLAEAPQAPPPQQRRYVTHARQQRRDAPSHYGLDTLKVASGGGGGSATADGGEQQDIVKVNTTPMFVSDAERFQRKSVAADVPVTPLAGTLGGGADDGRRQGASSRAPSFRSGAASRAPSNRPRSRLGSRRGSLVSNHSAGSGGGGGGIGGARAPSLAASAAGAGSPDDAWGGVGIPPLPRRRNSGLRSELARWQRDVVRMDADHVASEGGDDEDEAAAAGAGGGGQHQAGRSLRSASPLTAENLRSSAASHDAVSRRSTLGGGGADDAGGGGGAVSYLPLRRGVSGASRTSFVVPVASLPPLERHHVAVKACVSAAVLLAAASSVAAREWLEELMGSVGYTMPAAGLAARSTAFPETPTFAQFSRDLSPSHPASASLVASPSLLPSRNRSITFSSPLVRLSPHPSHLPPRRAHTRHTLHTHTGGERRLPRGAQRRVARAGAGWRAQDVRPDRLCHHVGRLPAAAPRVAGAAAAADAVGLQPLCRLCACVHTRCECRPGWPVRPRGGAGVLALRWRLVRRRRGVCNARSSGVHAGGVHARVGGGGGGGGGGGCGPVGLPAARRSQPRGAQRAVGAEGEAACGVVHRGRQVGGRPALRYTILLSSIALIVFCFPRNSCRVFRFVC